MDPVRVVLFTIIHRASSHLDGGIICLLNHIQRLKEDSNIQLLVVVAASEKSRAATEISLQSTGCSFLYIPFEKKLNYSRISYLIARLVGFSWERESVIFSVKKSLDGVLARWNPDCIIIDYLFSALFLKNDNRLTPIIISTLNREAEFYRQWSKWQSPKIKIRHILRAYRLSKFEKKAYQTATGVIALSSPDLPLYIEKKKTGVITPFLDSKKDLWKYSASKTAFFVGNINHHPNQEAICFIATRLAPEVAKLSPDIRFSIVGAKEVQVPQEWKHPSIDYLGPSTEDDVARLFQVCDIMLCPVTNNFGMKFKVAEAVSYGTPFLATAESIQCVPHLSGLPILDMKNPESCAKKLFDLMEKREHLENLSEFIIQHNSEFINQQRDIWSRTLKRIINW